MREKSLSISASAHVDDHDRQDKRYEQDEIANFRCFQKTAQNEPKANARYVFFAQLTKVCFV